MAIRQRRCAQIHEEIQAAQVAAEGEDQEHVETWHMWRAEKFRQFLSLWLQIGSFSAVLVSVAAGLSPFVRVSTFTVLSLSMTVMTAHFQYIKTNELLSIARLRLDVWKPVRVTIWAILFFSGALSLAEKLRVVEFDFLPLAYNEVVRTCQLSVFGHALYLAKMLFEVVPKSA